MTSNPLFLSWINLAQVSSTLSLQNMTLNDLLCKMSCKTPVTANIWAKTCSKKIVSGSSKKTYITACLHNIVNFPFVRFLHNAFKKQKKFRSIFFHSIWQAWSEIPSCWSNCGQPASYKLFQCLSSLRWLWKKSSQARQSQKEYVALLYALKPLLNHQI